LLEEGVWDSHRAVFVRTAEYIPITVQNLVTISLKYMYAAIWM